MIALRTQLTKTGFARDPAAGCYRKADLCFHAGEGWSWFERGAGTPPPAHRPSSSLGSPGLWRWLGHGPEARSLFELRTDLLHTHWEEGLEEETETSAFAACHDWAIATVDGGIPRDWRCPPRDEVEEWIDQGLLTVQSGSCLCQGELIQEPTRLALRMTLHPGLPESLPGPRRHWIETMLDDAQRQLHLVRLGWVPAVDRTAVVAEVDLSGAPHPLLKPLILASLAGLRATAGALAETVEMLGDLDVVSQVLAQPPVHASMH